MAKIEPKLPQEELDALIKVYMEKKKTNPSRIDRPLTYQIYNQLFNDKQRDVNACNCMDKDTDLKVVAYVEKNYKVEEPLPIESSVKIDLKGMTKPKRTRNKKTNEETNPTQEGAN